jgi:hypothetical protein
MLYARIRRAAEKACSQVDGGIDTSKVNAAALYAFFGSRHGIYHSRRCWPRNGLASAARHGSGLLHR